MEIRYEGIFSFFGAGFLNSAFGFEQNLGINPYSINEYCRFEI